MTLAKTKITITEDLDGMTIDIEFHKEMLPIDRALILHDLVGKYLEQHKIQVSQLMSIVVDRYTTEVKELEPVNNLN